MLLDGPNGLRFGGCSMRVSDDGNFYAVRWRRQGVLSSEASLTTVLVEVAAAKPRPEVLGPVADLRDGRIRLHLPRGFQYRSFHDTDTLTTAPPAVLDDGTLVPGRHDGMAAFPGPNGNVLLVRNHEINGPVPAFGSGTPYDANTGGGTTTTEVTHDGHVVHAFTSLNGTQMNCSGGPMPWGSWITCEETVNGPDVGPDFTGASNVTLQQRHGFIYEVPAGGQSNRQPVTSAGRFAHEAAAYSPDEGIVYLTEDNFSFPSGLYRYIPPVSPMMAGGARERRTAADVTRRRSGQRPPRSGTGERRNVRRRLGRHRRPQPVVSVHCWSAGPDHEQRCPAARRQPGTRQGAAHFSRLEGAVFTRQKIYFTSTQGGGPAETGPQLILGYGRGAGQVWSYNPRAPRC